MAATAHPSALPLPRASARSWLRLARLRVRARGRLRVEGPVRIGVGARIEVGLSGRVVLGAGCVLGDRARVEAAHGEVRIGPRTVLGERCTIVALCGVTIGSDCALGDYALVLDAGPSYDDIEAPIRVQPPRAAAVRIGDRVRLGPHAAVLAGASLGDDAVVEAGQTRARESSP